MADSVGAAAVPLLLLRTVIPIGVRNLFIGMKPYERHKKLHLLVELRNRQISKWTRYPNDDADTQVMWHEEVAMKGMRMPMNRFLARCAHSE